MKKFLGVLLIAVFVAFAFGGGTADAGGLTAFEAGVAVPDSSSNFDELRNSDSLSNARLYTFGEVDFDFMVTGWNLETGWTDGKRDDVTGRVELYARLFKVKGGSLEGLLGVDQPIDLGSGQVFGDERVYKFRLRHPL